MGILRLFMATRVVGILILVSLAHASSGSGGVLRKYFSDSGAALENGLLSVPNLSEKCSRDVHRFSKQIQNFIGDNGTVEDWALQMLDAWAKVPEGILSGHVNALGDFDECIAVREPDTDFQGKYCLIYVVPNATAADTGKEKAMRTVANLLKVLQVTINAELPMLPTVGTCLPSTCSDDEIFQIVRAILPNLSLIPVASFCRTDEVQKLGNGAIATIAVFAVLASLLLFGTLLDYAFEYNYFDEEKHLKRKLFQLTLAFSLPANWRKFMNTEAPSNDISCLHGIRFLSASWIVLNHTYLMPIIQPLWNVVSTYSEYTSSLSILIAVNGAIAVDAFFVIGGFLVSLTMLSMLKKSKGKMNIPLLYLQRYLRITPTYMLIVLFGTFIFPLLGSGPYWHVPEIWAGFCEKNWWKNMLYINNLPLYDTAGDPMDRPCHGMAWYLGVDMQLFLLTPFLLFPVWKWRRFGMIPLAVVTLASVAIPGVLTYINNYLPTILPFMGNDNNFSQEAYTPTYMRAAPYMLGMCTGILFNSVRSSSTFKLNRSVVLGAWLIAFAVGFTVLLSPHKFLGEYTFDRLESAIYATGHRTAWAIAISWLIFACATGHGGWINGILSWKPFVPLARLTFAIYLVSLHLQFLFHLQYRQPIYFTNYHMINLYFAHLVMSCLIALVCVLGVEAPFMQILKIIMPNVRGGGGSKKGDSLLRSRCSSNCSSNGTSGSESGLSGKTLLSVERIDRRDSVSPAPSDNSVRTVYSSITIVPPLVVITPDEEKAW